MPAIRVEEVLTRRVASAVVQNVELVIWRDDDGSVNAWDNRCPHRGVRLAIGTNNGMQLACRYHGWQFDSGSGACSFIPAHPSQPPPPAARVRTYRCVEKYGFVWVHLGNGIGDPSLPVDLAESTTTLRSMPFPAAAADTSARLSAELCGPVTVEATADRVYVLVVPAGADSCVVHGIVDRRLHGPERIALLRAMNDRFKKIRKQMDDASAELEGSAHG
jgi:nitrite reductase/ring-hydroxylating ferredoxin subunit